MEPDGRPTNLLMLREAKQRAEQLITTRYAEDLIDSEELERRLESLTAVDSLAQVDALTVDLLDPRTSAAGVGSLVLAEAAAPAALAPAQAPPTRALARAEDLEPERRRVALLSAVKESGRWVPARHNYFTTVLGELEIDLREALLGPGETIVEISCTLGEARILVPPELPVRVEASTLISEVRRDENIPEHPLSPEHPVIVVRGFVMLAELSIQQRLDGEGSWDAFWRRARERRQLRRARRAQRRAQRRLSASGSKPELPPGS